MQPACPKELLGHKVSPGARPLPPVVSGALLSGGGCEGFQEALSRHPLCHGIIL